MPRKFASVPNYFLILHLLLKIIKCIIKAIISAIIPSQNIEGSFWELNITKILGIIPLKNKRTVKKYAPVKWARKFETILTLLDFFLQQINPIIQLPTK